MEFLNVITEQQRDFILEPAYEGWGMLAALAIPFGIPAALTLSLANIKKITSNKIFKSYIKKECDKEFANLKKEYGNAITKDVPNNLKNYLYKKSISSQHKNLSTKIKNSLNYKTDINGYEIYLNGDTTHIQWVTVMFYNTKTNKIITHRISPPSKVDLNKLGFRKE